MSFEVNWSQANFCEKSRNTVSRRLRFLLGRFGAAILRVRVRFSDVNGPKGGVDKLCIVNATFRHGGEITIRSKGIEYLGAFLAGFERLVRTVRRELARQRDRTVRLNHRLLHESSEKNGFIPG